MITEDVLGKLESFISLDEDEKLDELGKYLDLSNTELDEPLKLFNFGVIIRVLKVKSAVAIYSPPTY